MSQLDDLKTRISEAGLRVYADRLLPLVRPCYRLDRVLTPDEHIPVGASKFGGSPDAPGDFTWPAVTGAGKDEPMEFVGQIRLEDLPEPVPEAVPGVPGKGLLSFFTRWSESAVFFHPEGTALRRIESPNPPVPPPPAGFVKRLLSEFRRNPDPLQTYRSCALKFGHGLSLPDGSASIITQLKMPDADSESYFELVLDPPSSASGKTQHQMFGYASPVQNEMELECDFVRRKEEVKWDSSPERFVAAMRDWILLLQVDTDDYKEGPGWMWGDAGMVYFWIHRDDLAAQAFDKVVCIEQCH
jgi:uncharacterized protein YwqG